jgi:hypothetical protein
MLFVFRLFTLLVSFGKAVFTVGTRVDSGAVPLFTLVTILETVEREFCSKFEYVSKRLQMD